MSRCKNDVSPLAFPPQLYGDVREALDSDVVTIFSTVNSFNSNKVRLFESGFFGGMVNPFIFQEELIYYHYKFIQLLNNPFRVD